MSREAGEAIACYRKAIEVKPDFAPAHINLCITLLRARDAGVPLAARRKAIELKPDLGQAYSILGLSLTKAGESAEAVTALYQKAVELQPANAVFHLNLGWNLLEQDHFPEALSAFKRANELGSRIPNWPPSNAQGAHEVERLIEPDAKLPKILKGEVQAANVAERLAMAQFCQLPCKSLYAAAFRFYSDAFFAEQPKALADDLQKASPGTSAAFGASQPRRLRAGQGR